MAENRTNRWRRLDNAATIFPATSGKRDPRVFRFSCELKEMVQEEVLQEALEETMQAYPGFRVVMRKGLFWHYLEKSDLVPQVHREDRPPCMKLYVRDKKGLLFEVTYFENRINFEVFHALTDGTGAMEFLKELVKNYLYRVHPDLDASVALRAADITQADKELDGFSHYYSGDLVEGKKEKVHSFQIKGVRAGYGNMKLREGMVSVAELLKKSREYGVTMTVFLTAVFLCAIHREMSPRQEKKPVYLMVPVNLRKFFPSESMLNFFGWIEVGYRFESGVTTFEDVLAHVKQFFKAELTKERVAMRMNALKKYEYNPFLRIAPLEVKNICLQAAAAFSKGNVTAIFSNMGAVQMPEEYAAYIETFDVYTSTPKIELCMCSFQDTAMLSFTSSFENDNIQRNFFRILNEQGLQCTERVPKMPEQKKEERTGILFFKCFSFACLVAAVIAGMVNILYTPDSYWAVLLIGVVFCMWLVMAIGFFKRRNLLKNAMWQMVFIAAASLIWDGATGWRGWAVDFVLPGIFFITLCSVFIIAAVQKLKPHEYMIYFLMAGACGLIPFILWLAGAVQTAFPSILCSGCSFLFLAGLAIFKSKEFGAELHKKFHI
ncbi:MAG TPA: hypothetical protein IAB48_02175 [Candidatus Fimimorpha excrementavium]|nr:hypothetical protein [Candidatus Fimimorpha excrementavium]